MPPTRGFTLLELVITLAVLGILSTLAMPSLGSRVDRARLVGTAEMLAADIAEARFEAARLGRLGAGLFLDLIPAEKDNPVVRNDLYNAHMIPGHTLARVWLGKDSLRIVFLDEDWLTEAVKDGRIAAITLVVVATTFVTDAMSNSVSRRVGCSRVSGSIIWYSSSTPMVREGGFIMAGSLMSASQSFEVPENLEALASCLTTDHGLGHHRVDDGGGRGPRLERHPAVHGDGSPTGIAHLAR